MWTFFLNYLVKFYLNNMVNLHPLTPHITPSYTHKMENVYRDHRFCDVISPYVCPTTSSATLYFSQTRSNNEAYL